MLPGHLVPARYVPLTALPRLADGGVDLAALPQAGQAAAMAGAADPAAPAGEPAQPSGSGTAADQERLTTLRTRLGEIWAEQFGIARVGPDDDFFALGGHSILALQLLSIMEDELAVTLPVSVLLDAPTIRRLAVVVAGKLGDQDAVR